MAHRSRSTILLALASAGSVLVAGCGAGGSQDPAPGPSTGTTASAGTTAAPARTATATPEPTPAASPSSAATQTFVAADGGLMFDHPATWRVTETPGFTVPMGEPGTEVTVSDESGRQLAVLKTSSNVLGFEMCEPLPYEPFVAEPIELVGDDPADGPPLLVADAVRTPADGSYGAPSEGKAIRFALSIHGTEPPYLGDEQACNVYGLFRRAPGTAYSSTYPYAEFRAERWFVDLDEARDHLQSEEFARIADMMRSLEFAVSWS